MLADKKGRVYQICLTGNFIRLKVESFENGEKVREIIISVKVDVLDAN